MFGFCFLCYSNQCTGHHTVHSRWCFRAVHIAAVRRHAASHHEECAPSSQDPFCVRPECLPSEWPVTSVVLTTTSPLIVLCKTLVGAFGCQIVLSVCLMISFCLCLFVCLYTCNNLTTDWIALKIYTGKILWKIGRSLQFSFTWDNFNRFTWGPTCIWLDVIICICTCVQLMM